MGDITGSFDDLLEVPNVPHFSAMLATDHHSDIPTLQHCEKCVPRFHNHVTDSKLRNKDLLHALSPILPNIPITSLRWVLDPAVLRTNFRI